MNLSDFDYELPPERIAQVPAEPRDSARLLAHRIALDDTEHRRVRDLPELLRRGDLLVVNDTRVRPARLCGRRETGGAAEILVLGPAPEPGLWRALVKPAGRLKPGEELSLEEGSVVARAVRRSAGESGEPGAEWTLALRDPRAPDLPVEDLLERSGRMPLPPYIRRGRGADPERERDRRSYQTVYARASGAVAAPTAGLHFTPELLSRLESRGVERAAITLHVGPGTFRPVTAERVEDHVMHPEEYELPESTAAAIGRARERGGRVIAVGTTSARVLETCADGSGLVAAGRGTTSMFLHPGRPPRAIDGLMTNFHLPRSTLLMLVSAFAGRERVLRLYREAVESGYRFYSYGDAMLLL